MRQHAADLSVSEGALSPRAARLLHLAWIGPAALLVAGLTTGSAGVVALAMGLAAGSSLSGSI